MHHRIGNESIALIAFLGAISITLPATARVQSNVPPVVTTPYNWSEVDSLLQNTITQSNASGDTKIPGFCLQIRQDGYVIYQKVFDNPAVNSVYDLTTYVPIASSTKWVSTATVMKLIDLIQPINPSLLSLDAQVSPFIPAVLQNNENNYKGQINLRQLLSHTSAIEPQDLAEDDNPGNDGGTISDDELDIQNVAAIICAEPLLRLPGSQTIPAAPGRVFGYGGNSFQVAGAIAEQVYASLPGNGGKRWDDLFQEQIAGPLRLTSTDYAFNNPSQTFPLHVTNPRIAGGVRSTVLDMGVFVQMLADGGKFEGRQILPESRVSELFRNQTTGVTRVSNNPSDLALSYGLGAFRDIVDPAPASNAVWDTNPNATAVQVSDGGAYGFTPWIDLQRNLVGVLLVKDSPAKAGTRIVPMAHRIQEILREQSDATAPFPWGVTPEVSVTRTGFTLNRATGRFTQTVTITNPSTNFRTIPGPVSLACDTLSPGATLYQPTGTVARLAPLGGAYKVVGGIAGGLAPGQSARLTIEFVNPTKSPISYTPRILSGAGTP